MNKRKIVFIICLLLIIFVSLIGATYSYFANIVTNGNNATRATVTIATLDINFSTTDCYNVSNINLIDDNNRVSEANYCRFTVTMPSTVTTQLAFANILLKNISISNNLKSEYLKWELLTYDNSSYLENTSNIINYGDFSTIGSNTTLNLTNDYPIALNNNVTRYLAIRVWLSNDNDVNQNELQNGTFQSKIKVDAIADSFNNNREFAYTGSQQYFEAPKSGNYKIELWGASGGGAAKPSGGYTSGIIMMNSGDKINIYVGGFSSTAIGGWNGGGNGYSATGGAGGGATDIRLIGGDYKNNKSLASRIMVAGAGGASIVDTVSRYTVGYAGGLMGATYSDNIYPSYIATGGTQTIGGIVTNYSSSFTPGTNGVFGIGGNGGGANYGGSGGGGGGYYGGAGGSRLNNGNWGGGGGSSYISGHAGCVAIDNALDESEPRIIKSGCNASSTSVNCSIHYSNKQFIQGTTKIIDGAGYLWTTIKGTYELMPKPDGGYYLQGIGHTGDGYAKITYQE